jgi:cytochrome P450
VVDNAITILFAGHDTSSSIMVRMFDLLVRHPDVMIKVRGGAGRGMA